MPTYVSLLRAVNVAGVTVTTASLRAIHDALGYSEVTTYIQTGNTVFRASARSASAVAKAIEGEIARELGIEVAVVVRTPAELAQIVAENPFLRRGADAAKLHVTFLAATPGSPDLAALRAVKSGRDEFELVGREVYVHCPDGYGTTKLNNALFERKLAVAATTRNWRTVTKLHELASAR